MNTLTRSLTALGVTISLAGCASPGYYGNTQYRNTLAGAAIGAAGGALIGHAADDGRGNGALMGGTLGAVAGGAVGYAMDRKQKEGHYDYRRDGYDDGYYYRSPQRKRRY